LLACDSDVLLHIHVALPDRGWPAFAAQIFSLCLAVRSRKWLCIVIAATALAGDDAGCCCSLTCRIGSLLPPPLPHLLLAAHASTATNDRIAAPEGVLAILVAWTASVPVRALRAAARQLGTPCRNVTELCVVAPPKLLVAVIECYVTVLCTNARSRTTKLSATSVPHLHLVSIEVQQTTSGKATTRPLQHPPPPLRNTESPPCFPLLPRWQKTSAAWVRPPPCPSPGCRSNTGPCRCSRTSRS